VVVALVVAGAGVLVALWSGATLSGDSSALAKVALKPFAGSLAHAKAFGPDGRPIPLTVRDGRLTPLQQVTPGERISVDVTIRRPGWLGWALGTYRTVRLSVTAPVAQVRSRWLTVASGAPVSVAFAHPVSAVSYSSPGQPPVSLRLNAPTATITLAGLAAAGTVSVSAAARSWEKPSAPVAVSWFPVSSAPVLIADPAPGSNVSPLQPIRLTFSQPVANLFGSKPPSVAGAAHGTWRQLDSHTLLFTPAGVGAPLGTQLHFTLTHAVAVSSASGELSPASDQLAWTVPVGSPLRLQQLLAQLGWLPLNWTPTGAPVAHRRPRRWRRPAAISAGATRTRRRSLRRCGRPGTSTRSSRAR
jgi:hypothetical protein